MPVYEYKCAKCAREFEAEQRITEPPLTECVDDKCKGNVHRLIPRTSFTLKGAGWFRSGGY